MHVGTLAVKVINTCMHPHCNYKWSKLITIKLTSAALVVTP
jgi:hypothetical protein